MWKRSKKALLEGKKESQIEVGRLVWYQFETAEGKEEVMDENLDGSFVGCLQQLMRIGGESRRGCRIAKVRRTRGVPTNRQSQRSVQA